MTTTVIINAHCSKTKQVHALIVDQLKSAGHEVLEEIVLQDGETAQRVVFDGRVISIQEMDKEALESALVPPADAPRITPEHIAEQIIDEQYYVFPGTTLTVCCLTLQNGFNVTGESACASPAYFNAEKGREIARANAVQKIWSLEGYRLKCELAQAPL